MIRGIIFDLDGTLLNTLEDLTDAVNVAMREFGFPEKTIEDVRLGIGRGFRKLMEAVVPKEADDKTRETVGNRFIEYYSANYKHKTRPYEGINEVLEILQEKGIKLAVNSNKGDSVTKELIAESFPKISFVAVFGERAGVPHKPDPGTANEIIGLMGLTKEEVLYIGDSDTDITTGINAGTRTAGCLWGFRDYETLAGVGADYILKEPKEILDCL